jgi:alkanesulfonate monooxygenase SsuD/methylene tetrahydromethanopterin reductase-like flavin-dependent oxidoreductase (luciferase family)
MKFGLWDHVDASGQPFTELLDDRLAFVAAADELGYYCYHVAEHHATPLNLVPVPGVYLGAVAQATRDIKLGPLVYLLPLYSPLRLIEEICILDQLSGGRLEFGVGRGVSPYEVGYFGVNPKDGPRQFPEALNCIKQGLSHDRLTFHGEFYDYDDVPIVMSPVQKPYPPIWYGLHMPDTAYWACKEAANFVMLGTVEVMTQVVAKYKEHWSGEFGRDPDKLPLMGIQRHIVLRESEDEAVEIMQRIYRPWVANMRRLWEANGTTLPLGLPDEADAFLEHGHGYAGTPAGFKDFLAEMAETVGANYFVADLAFGDITFEEAKKTTELLARDVMPAFADTGKKKAAAE